MESWKLIHFLCLFMIFWAYTWVFSETISYMLHPSFRGGRIIWWLQTKMSIYWGWYCGASLHSHLFLSGSAVPTFIKHNLTVKNSIHWEIPSSKSAPLLLGSLPSGATFLLATLDLFSPPQFVALPSSLCTVCRTPEWEDRNHWSATDLSGHSCGGTLPNGLKSAFHASVRNPICLIPHLLMCMLILSGHCPLPRGSSYILTSCHWSFNQVAWSLSTC